MNRKQRTVNVITDNESYIFISILLFNKSMDQIPNGDIIQTENTNKPKVLASTQLEQIEFGGNNMNPYFFGRGPNDP